MLPNNINKNFNIDLNKNLLLSKLLVWAEKLFIKHKLYFGHGTTTAWDEAVYVASHVLNLNLYVQKLKDQYLNHKNKLLFIKIVKLRIKTKQPLAYIIKTAWFAQKKYYVDNRVIIPRSPFAELISNRFKPWIKFTPNSILDLCTGSGCMAIACYYAFIKNNANLKIDAIDISSKALQVARKNLKLHKITNRISIIKSDLFNNISNYKYDLIISNPPYVDAKTFNKLPKEFYFEPKIALVADNNGLELVIHILNTASNFLSDRGVLIIEVGYLWKQFIKMVSNKHFTSIKLCNGGEGIFLLTKKQLDRLCISV